MAHRRKVIAVSFLILLSSMMQGCERDASQLSDVKTPARPVRIMAVTARPQVQTHSYPARIQADRSTLLSFQVSGRLEKFPFREGDTLEPGDLVAELDPTDYELAYRQAQLQAELLLKELDRKKLLNTQGHVPDEVLEQAQVDYDLASVKVDQAERHISHTKLLVPFRALLAKRLVEKFVNLSAGEAVVLLQDISVLAVEVSIPEQTVLGARPDHLIEAKAAFSSDPTTFYPIKLKEIATEPDQGTRSYLATFSLNPPEDRSILPGMSATAYLSLKSEPASTLAVPLGAVTTAANDEFRVWVFDEKTGLISSRTVELGEWSKSQVEVLSGLTEGEYIVTAGAGYLHEGQKVRAVE